MPILQIILALTLPLPTAAGRYDVHSRATSAPCADMLRDHQRNMQQAAPYTEKRTAGSRGLLPLVRTSRTCSDTELLGLLVCLA